MIAALFVETGGAYYGLDGVDPWPASRDARLYPGPWPVVAHPPCQRWGAFWMGSPTVVARTGVRKKRGDDGGCFASALDAVRRFGGVLEHPRGSYAWQHFGLHRPERWGAWVAADFHGGWTCCVDQGWYGHRASKATWLYAVRSGAAEPDVGAEAVAPAVVATVRAPPAGEALRGGRVPVAQGPRRHA